MSFSSDVKKELCAVKQGCSFCTGSRLYSMLLFGDAVKGNAITFTTESKATADLFALDLIELSGAILTIKEPDLRDASQRPVYTISVDYSDDVLRILSQFRLPDRVVRRRFFPNSCCVNAFLRGAYLACGTMSNPFKEYHLEFRVPHKWLAEGFVSILLECGLSYRITQRTAQFIVYAKESNVIEDTLTRMGAVHSAMEMMNLKIEKELRNNTNRIVNCETANIEKTVNASISQIQKIKKIKDTIGLEGLPTSLQEAALLRLANPDATLSELCILSNGTISKSGMNHRLARLSKIADELPDI